MKLLTLLNVSVFSPVQIVGIVLISVLLAAFIALDIYIGYLIHKRGVHKMHTRQLQDQRDALMKKLGDIRSGKYGEYSYAYKGGMVVAPEPEDEEPEDDTDEVEENIEPEDTDVAERDVQPDDENENLELEVTDAGTVVRYNRSFTARLTQADNDLKARYSELKNCLMCYFGVKARMSWKRETFHIGRTSVASFTIRGKTLCLHLATETRIFDGTKYKVEDMSGRSGKNTMPCMYRITSDRKVSYAKELIEIVMAGFATFSVRDYKPQDFTLPYKSTEVLIKQRLIKIVGDAIPDLEKEEALARAMGIRYNRSFEARVIQSDDELKSRYSKLKNYIMAHAGISPLNSWKRESFRVGRNIIASFIIRGKTLCLCLATDPKQFDGTKYKVEDLSLRNKNANTPLMYRVKSDRKLGYAKDLIDKVCAEREIAKAEIEEVNYVVPFIATETLVRRGLIKKTDIKAKDFIASKSVKAEENTAETATENIAVAEPDVAVDTSAEQAENEAVTVTDMAEIKAEQPSDTTEAEQNATTTEAEHNEATAEANITEDAAKEVAATVDEVKPKRTRKKKE